MLIHDSYKTYEHKASTIRTPCATDFGHIVRMKTPKDRLRHARAEAGFENPTEAARSFPRILNQNTLISHENGNREISRKAAEKYAQAFGVEAGWILFGETKEASTEDFDVPLLSMVAAGNLRAQIPVTESDVDRRIKVGSLPKGDWVALQVEGDSMDRVAPEGAIIIVDRSDDRLLDGRYYVFSLGGGEATFKRYRRTPQRLQPFSTNPDHMSISADDDNLYVFGRVRRVIHDI